MRVGELYAYLNQCGYPKFCFRVMSNLRDVLELESSNMSEAVSRLEAALKVFILTISFL